MVTLSATMAASHPPSHSILLVRALAWILMIMAPMLAHAEAPTVPWECSAYEGAAQSRCLNAFIELQREKIGQLEQELQSQQGTVAELKDRMERQATATADLQRQLMDRPSQLIVPAPYSYAYVYPPTFGFGLYFGRPWVYGFPYPYRPYWGPHYYRHWGYRR